MNPVILIPARMGSTRLPGKMLKDINGLPLIVHVAKRALDANIAPVYVACDAPEIQQALQDHGIESVLTNPDLPSGSDRIFAALETQDPNKQFDIVLNVQGDLPNISPEALGKTLGVLKNQTFDIATLACEIKDHEDYDNPNIVKIAVDPFNVDSLESDSVHNAYYFSRACIPHGPGPKYHHIGLYAYRRSALEQFVKSAPAPLETFEKLEQLRALHLGMKIGVALTNEVPLSIDTADDLEKARRVMAKT